MANDPEDRAKVFAERGRMQEQTEDAGGEQEGNRQNATATGAEEPEEGGEATKRRRMTEPERTEEEIADAEKFNDLCQRFPVEGRGGAAKRERDDDDDEAPKGKYQALEEEEEDDRNDDVPRHLEGVNSSGSAVHQQLNAVSKKEMGELRSQRVLWLDDLLDAIGARTPRTPRVHPCVSIAVEYWQEPPCGHAWEGEEERRQEWKAAARRWVARRVTVGQLSAGDQRRIAEDLLRASRPNLLVGSPGACEVEMAVLLYRRQLEAGGIFLHAQRLPESRRA